MRIYVGRQFFSGEAVQILRAMKEQAEGVEELDLSEYIDWIIESAAAIDGVFLDVDDGPLHWRAKCLLESLLDEGLASLQFEVRDSERTTATFPVAMPQDA
jgi:hypothetical protein